MDQHDPMGSQFSNWPSDLWVDPEADRVLVRRQLRRHRMGYSLLSLSLVVASLSTIGQLILIFSGQRRGLGAVLGISQWDLIEDTVVVFATLLGVALLFGRWPDENWRRRSGLLLLMAMIDVVLWGLDHANELGIADGRADHEWFCRSLGAALGWSEFALLAGLAGDEASQLGEPQAADFAKAVRSLATTGAMVWFSYFYFRTDWTGPLWPLRERPLDRNGAMLALGYAVLGAILLVQTSGLTLLAGRCCERTLREMAAEDKAVDLLPSRSEAGWEEMNSRSNRDG